MKWAHGHADRTDPIVGELLQSIRGAKPRDPSDRQRVHLFLVGQRRLAAGRPAEAAPLLKRREEGLKERAGRNPNASARVQASATSRELTRPTDGSWSATPNRRTPGETPAPTRTPTSQPYARAQVRA